MQMSRQRESLIHFFAEDAEHSRHLKSFSIWFPLIDDPLQWCSTFNRLITLNVSEQVKSDESPNEPASIIQPTSDLNEYIIYYLL